VYQPADGESITVAVRSGNGADATAVFAVGRLGDTVTAELVDGDAGRWRLDAIGSSTGPVTVANGRAVVQLG